MAANKSKPKSPKEGATASNLLASMPWLKNKAFFIPALASVLVVSLVGVVLAVQATNSPAVDQDSSDISLDESNTEEAIGFACVEGTPICDEVKSILLGSDYDDVVANWTRESLIAHIEYKYGRSRTFATEVVDAVRFDWGDGSTYAGSDTGMSGSGSSSGSGSGSGSASSSIPCSGSASVCAFLKEIYGLGQFDDFIKEDLVSYIVRTYRVTQASAEATVDSTGYIWGDRGLPEIERAARNLTNEASRLSRVQVAEYMRDTIGLDYSDSLVAIDALGVNWNLKAQQQAQFVANQGPLSRLALLYIVEDLSKFEADEAVFAVDSLNIDWYDQAFEMARLYLEGNSCDEFPGAQDLFDVLYDKEGFTQDQAEDAVFGHFTDFEQESETIWAMYPVCP